MVVATVMAAASDDRPSTHRPSAACARRAAACRVLGLHRRRRRRQASTASTPSARVRTTIARTRSRPASPATTSTRPSRTASSTATRGGGNDGCNQHVCCLRPGRRRDDRHQRRQGRVRDAGAEVELEQIQPRRVLRAVRQHGRCRRKCTMNCGPLTPPGCDCFGCCTVCNAQGCEDIVINPAVSPNCDQTNITDPGPDGIEGTADDPCKRCVKSATAATTDVRRRAVRACLCPGQDPSTLAVELHRRATCPPGFMACDATAARVSRRYVLLDAAAASATRSNRSRRKRKRPVVDANNPRGVVEFDALITA